jgi:hypothetical protein
MSIKEILEELPKLTPEERQELRDWLSPTNLPKPTS